MPKVSVIVPCYNVAPYVAKCLDSLVAQTLQDIEIICVDDKSTDDTAKIVAEYAKRDKRIKLIKQRKNQGVSVARNTAIDAAHGEFIGFMDSDDLLPDPEVLSDMYNAAIQNKVKICGGSIIRWNPNTGEAKIHSNPVDKFPSNGMVKYSDWPNDYGFTRFIYDRKWLIKNKILFPTYIRHEDPVFFVHAMCLAGEFYALSRPTYKYRVSYKSVNWTDQSVHDVFCGLRDCLNIAKEFNMPQLYFNIVKHTDNFVRRVRSVNEYAVYKIICDVMEQIAECMPNNFVPARFYLNMLKKHNKKLYDFYVKDSIRNKHIYLFNLIPIFRIKYARSGMSLYLFESLPLGRCDADNKSRRYYLFNIIPILKIRG